MKNKILALLLAFLLLISMFPAAVFAAEEAQAKDPCPYCEETIGEDGSVLHDEFCNAAYAYDGTADLQKYVELSYFSKEYGVSVSENPRVDPVGLVFYEDEFGEHTIMQIVDWYWDAKSSGLWYCVKLHSGAFPESTEEYVWPEEAWIFQIYTDNWAETDKALSFVTVPESTCSVCGAVNCTALHFYCEFCRSYECTQEHLYCLACGDRDCIKTHIWCGTCGKFDCGMVHEDLYTPVVAPVIPDAPILTEGAEVSVVDAAGDPVTEDGLYLPEGTQCSLSAWSSFDDAADVSYQWQIRYDSLNDRWANIQGQTGKGILLSPAVVLSILETDGTAAIRCVVSSGGQTQTGAAIPVEVGSETVTFFAAKAAPAAAETVTLTISFVNEDGETVAETETHTVPTDGTAFPIPAVSGCLPVLNSSSCHLENGNLIVGTLTEDTSVTVLYKKTEEVYIVVSYEYADGRTAAATDIAEIIPGLPYEHSYPLPVVPGYESSLKTHSFGDSVQIVDGALNVNLAANALQDEYTTFTVTYSPAFVPYTVVHYWQNVDNDNYREHESEEIRNKKKTGEVISEAHKVYPGFYHLLYETPTAAADGSTVIEVYYNRYYYLMKFDLGDMGYGVDPIYARYGAAIEIGEPTRKGYVFGGWKLNGEEAEIPATMPTENRTYEAIWTPVPKADVSVVFWGENADDEGYSYIGTKKIEADTGDTLSWDSYSFSCGNQAHTHNALCGYNCQKTEHVHSVENGCYRLTCTQVPHNHTSDGCTLNCQHVCTLDCYAPNEDNTYRYTYSLREVSRPSNLSASLADGLHSYKDSGWGGETHYYLKLGDKWYCVYRNNSERDTTSIKSDCDHDTHDNSCYTCGKQANDHTHTTGCYEEICGQEAHTHSAACGYACGVTKEHVHSSRCGTDQSGLKNNLYTMVRSETVIVEPDGTTVINVYYDRTTFTLTFHYNYSNRTYKNTSTITDKWGANIGTRFLEINTTAGGNLWSTDTGGGSPWTGYLQVMPQHNVDYYLRNTSNNKQSAQYYTQGLDGTYTLAYTVDVYYDSNLTISAEDFYEMDGFDYSHGTDGGNGNMAKPGSYGKFDGAKLYYDRHQYAIEFYNPTNLIKKTDGIPYEADLGNYGFTPTADQAPDLYEPGTVTFAGWYLNPECTGEQVTLAGRKMPSAPKNGDTALVLYAKWEPVNYRVNYYLTQDSLNRGETIPEEMERLVNEAVASGVARPEKDPYTEVFQQIIVKHGAYIPNPSDPEVSEGYVEIHPRAGYDFVGWFYLNEDGEETAFDPENLPVTQDLNLYAKWSSNTLCAYNVYFALDQNNDNVADTDEQGRIIYVADPISGSGIADSTYTFAAKGGDELYNLGEGANYREGYFPVVGSHSITVDIRDPDGTGTNSFIFLYQTRGKMPYTVRYLEKDTENVLAAPKVVEDNDKVVITEYFEPVSGYMPDAYQKTLVVTTDEDANEIIFWYNKDDQHAIYAVNYYIQDLDSDLNHRGWSKYTDLQNTGKIGQTCSVGAISIDGFTLSAEYTDLYNGQMKSGFDNSDLPAAVSELTDGVLSGELSANGLELNFYYTRNLYPYEFRYMLLNTATELASPKAGKAGYGMTVTEAAEEIELDLDGDGVPEDYRLYDPTEQTKTINIKKDGDPLSKTDTVSAGQAKINVTTFFYVRCTQTMTITKQVVDKGINSHPDPDQEFRFNLLIHAQNGFHRNYYDYTLSDGTSGTLERVLNTLPFTLKAGQTITIEGLPTARYTISEIDIPTGYYDTYAPAAQNTLTVDQQVDVMVTNTYEPANLQISKTVLLEEDHDNVPEVPAFEFAITVPLGITGTVSYRIQDQNGTGEDVLLTEQIKNGVVTIELQKGQTAVFENLPTGDYSITEADYLDEGYKSSYSIDGGAYSEDGVRTAGVTLSRGKTTAVDFRNRFPVGDLTIEKTVTKAFYGTPWAGDSFVFTVQREKKLITGNRYDVYMGETLLSTCEVQADGTLQVFIPFSEADAAQLDEETEKDGSVVHSVVIRNLPTGTYTVTEEEKADYVQSARTIGNLAIPSDTPMAAFTNQLIRPTGSLSLEKELVPEKGYTGPLNTDLEFSFTITLTQMPPETAQIKVNNAVATMTNGEMVVKLKAGESVELQDLPIGVYRITEATVPQYANDFAHWVDGEWVPQPPATANNSLYTEIAVVENEVSRVKCTNTYPVDWAELVIQKLVTREYDRDTLPGGEFYFTVELDGDYLEERYAYTVYDQDETIAGTGTATVTNKSFTLSLEAGQYAVVPGLPVCGYTVTENVDTQLYNASYEVYLFNTGDRPSEEIPADAALHASGDGNSFTGSFSAAKTDAVIFTNEYKRQVGTLTITKEIVGTPSETGEFIFRITGEGVDMDVVIYGAGSTTIYDLPMGTYTVTEDAAWSWRYTGEDSKTVTLTPTDKEGAVTFTNTCKPENPWLNFFTSVKNIFSKGGRS